MKGWKIGVIAAAVLVGWSMRAQGDDATSRPSGDEAAQTLGSGGAPSKSGSKLVPPFNLLTDLTDDQKEQIKEIHKEEKAKEKELKTKEHDDIMALLTDDQKKELADTLAKEEAEKKSQSMQKRADSDERRAKDLREKAAAATQPSN
jgi:Spy/CpxP family protein refolding chaperone